MAELWKIKIATSPFQPTRIEQLYVIVYFTLVGDFPKSIKEEEESEEVDLSYFVHLINLSIDGRFLKSRITVLNLGDKSKLTFLNLPNNKLTDLDLSQCNSLNEINLDNNKFTSLAFLYTLPHPKNLTRLELANNDINIKAVDLELLSSLKSSVYSDISNNFKSQIEEKVNIDGSYLNSSLTKLELDNRVCNELRKTDSCYLEELRKKKLNNLLQNPFQQTKFIRTSNIQKIIQLFSHLPQDELARIEEKVSIAGRIMPLRNFGNLIFADLADQTGIIQLKVSKNKDFAELDSGDIIGIKGIICKTNKGELSVEVKEFILLSKCLKPIPDTSYYGFTDIEERFRKRYLDFITNRENRKIFIIRHKVIQSIRKFLDEREFIEIETPILVSEASGAQAKPFITHHNKLQRDFYLRIATEIPLKKLLIGGFEKVYEVGRIFRNEGIDARHNPEFTTIEVYQSYENSEYMMNLTEELFRYLANKVLKKEEIEFNSHIINLKNPFRKLSMVEAIKEHTGIDFSHISNLEKALELAKKHNLKLEKFQKTIGHVILTFFEEYAEKKLIQPTFIYDYPIEVSPLAKSKTGNENIADRFELYIGGIEFANGYSELNDPIEQKKRFEEQTKQKELGNEEIASFDKDFLEALEYGMPPAGGLGIGIDRLIMLFTSQNSIKEVIAFPQLKKNVKEISLKGREDSEVRKIILDNFSSLFPYLELYNEGKQYTIPYGFRGKRKPDSLAFHEKEKRLYIFEYKSRIDEELIVQTSNYRNALQNNKDNLHDLKDK
ncbi:9169_t:CDS:2 [Entrophospora sp. SA101]|nr:9169_t:CDS:2 [Entrophospora sp. SA101]